VLNIAGRGRIARQYALADTLGAPYTITIDKETFENNTVTIRERDTKEQKRLRVPEMTAVLRDINSCCKRGTLPPSNS